MVFLSRSRNVIIKRLEEKPPKSLDEVYNIISAAVTDCLERLKDIEEDFYGKGVNPAEEIKKWSGPIYTAILSVGISMVTSKRQVDGLAKTLTTSKKKDNVDLLSLGKLVDAQKKVLAYCPSVFRDTTADLQSILTFLEKYCQSFFDPSSGIGFETVRDYEKNRLEWKKEITKDLSMLTLLPQKYKGDGLIITDLGLYGKELAHQTEVFKLAFLFIFPQSCDCIRHVCKLVRAWVDTDRHYPQYVTYDMREFEEKKTELSRTIRELQDKCYSLGHSLKLMQQKCSQLESELIQLLKQENELIADEELLKDQFNDLKLEVGRNEWQREELLKNSLYMHPEILHEKFSEITELLKSIKRKLPTVEKKLDFIKQKLAFIRTRKDEINSEKKARDATQKELSETEEEKLQLEAEYEHIMKLLELARRVYTVKTTPDCVSKLYYDQPMETSSQRLPGQKKGIDPFEKACVKTSQLIDKDWQALYRALPFAPSRGAVTIDDDLAYINDTDYRSGSYDKTRRSLDRWRRFHTRAKIEDLLHALKTVGRKDIVTLIETDPDIQNTRRGGLVVQEDVEEYPNVDPELIKLLKQIERFDAARAAAKAH